MNDYEKIQESIENMGKKLDESHKELNDQIKRIVQWAEGDPKLGRKPIHEQIDDANEHINSVSRRSYKNENNIKLMKQDIDENIKPNLKETEEDLKSQKRDAGFFGFGGGAIISAIIEGLKFIARGL